MRKLISIFLLLFVFPTFIYSGWFSSEKEPEEGGVDLSFPQHHYLDKNTWGGKRYDDFMQGCYKRYAKKMEENGELELQQNNHTKRRQVDLCLGSDFIGVFLRIF